MIGALITGTLARDPEQRTARNGTGYVTATIRVPAGADAVFVSVTAFDQRAAERLMQMRTGGAVSACGTLEQTSWTTQAGEARTGWRLTASEILSVYQARKRRDAGEGAHDA
ncbi:MAG: single-stranded DNA-binding protein [Burkholderiaceae bacterium]|nr:single-stranded DNA-binding protein [Burkholderiaceae bacterium]MEB2352016.1 single-stranded DNA-binding protein [Burkholderiaceae bacterium]